MNRPKRCLKKANVALEVKYSCTECGLDCVNSADSAVSGSHQDCQKLTQEQIWELEENPESYICKRCIAGSDGCFDFRQSCLRINQDSGIYK